MHGSTRCSVRAAGDHYLHSTFCDLALSGLVGVHVQLDVETSAPPPAASTGGVADASRAPAPHQLVVDPLVPTEPDARGLRWFAARHMPVQGRLVDVAYDADGSRYGGGAGLAVWVDGELVASAPTLRRLVVPLAVRESL